ncbi:cryptochrome-1-like isoform X3 [Xiphophorus hellerii]|uniref:cryptochrome-1-like isoform X3 n=1 Tax=Xiphophorus hellerii TaxID=8084 RepID=UPI0013B3A8A7|nr:cryptochrome-1-like isoform X3 [Xiphophorus hellerii]
MAPNSIHWFRKGLRLHDNPALREAVRGAGTVRCVYFLDPWFAGSSNVGVNRWRFLLQCLEDLDASLRKLNSRLFVIRGQPANVFPRLFKEWKISRLTFEYDSEPFGKERDAAIKKLAMEAGVEVIVKISHTLYDLDKIIELNGGQPPLTYKRFQTLISRLDPPEKPVETLSDALMGGCVTPVSEDHGEKYGVPSLEELGFDTEGLPSAVWPGGETEALTRIERHLERKAWVANFERPRMNANSLLASPTGLSPYLRFGCLSCRLFYFKLTDLYRKVKKNSSPPLSLYGQLLWREFFYTAATNNPRFDKMEGNPICVRIPWDKNPEALAKWAEAKTGFPWIDAIMTQLRQEGWIHHLARHAVACFLTRGDLWISWEEGMKVFRGAASGRRLECECGQLDVAVLQFILSAVFPLLLPCGLRPAHRPQRGLHQAILTCSPRFSRQVHLRPLERPRVRSGGSQVYHRSPLPETHGAPRGGQPAQHREDEADLPAAEPIQRPGSVSFCPLHKRERERRNDGLLPWRAAVRDQQQQFTFAWSVRKLGGHRQRQREHFI